MLKHHLLLVKSLLTSRGLHADCGVFGPEEWEYAGLRHHFKPVRSLLNTQGPYCRHGIFGLLR